MRAHGNYNCNVVDLQLHLQSIFAALCDFLSSAHRRGAAGAFMDTCALSHYADPVARQT